MRYDPYAKAEQENIYIYETKLALASGYYQRTQQSTTVLIEHSLPEPEKRCILTHELMHHKYTPDGFSPALFDKFCYAKHEKFIERKTAEKLIPKEELINFLENNPEATIWDIADYFCVTERMLRIRIESLKKDESWRECYERRKCNYKD